MRYPVEASSVGLAVQMEIILFLRVVLFLLNVQGLDMLLLYDSAYVVIALTEHPSPYASLLLLPLLRLRSHWRLLLVETVDSLSFR